MAMSLSECGGVFARVLTPVDCHSLSVADAPYADMCGELGGDKGMRKFPSTIGAFGGGGTGVGEFAVNVLVHAEALVSLETTPTHTHTLLT